MNSPDTDTDTYRDQPLRVGSALAKDTLHRENFAKVVKERLLQVSNTDGLVVSMEGAWGSGKTSLIAIIQDLLNEQPEDITPVIVHFNPWLIGGRDALLGQFLAKIATEVNLADNSAVGKRVAKELNTYSKAFDLLKFIPGAEPWASIVKTVLTSVGNATGELSEHKAPDIEARKNAVEQALLKFSRPIVVIVDDIDRLYPEEVFEMVRIIKAVGDLPNIAYLLAWDPSYVSSALEKLNVPYAPTYLDKVVQIRLPIPPLSPLLRDELMSDQLDKLSPEALQEYFPDGRKRLVDLFRSGLGELMEQPRDIIRLFAVVASIEPNLRGEIYLADIIGLACLMTKAPKVYELLRQTPQAFIGEHSRDRPVFNTILKVLKRYEEPRELAFRSCAAQTAVRDLVAWLFPQLLTEDETLASDTDMCVEGCLADAESLHIALHQSTQTYNRSLVLIRKFLFHPDKRDGILGELGEQSSVHFIEQLGDMAQQYKKPLDTEALSIATSRFIETAFFVKNERDSRRLLSDKSMNAAVRFIQKISKELNGQALQALAENLITDPIGLSVAARIAVLSFHSQKTGSNFSVKAPQIQKESTLAIFAQNLQNAAERGTLLDTSAPDYILLAAALLIPDRCAKLFTALTLNEPTWDKFIETYLYKDFGGVKGASYALPVPTEYLERFVALDELKRKGAQRLQDESMTYPARAAWRAVVEGGELYGKDGSPVKG